VSANTFAVGAVVYWDDTAKVVTSTASGNTRVGLAVTAAANPSVSVNVRLDG
jgi:predicted RecA/RadA family phage recombinase